MVETTPSQIDSLVVGEINPSSDNSCSIGSASFRFTEVYAVNGSIQTSDFREKKEIAISDLGMNFINKLSPVSYKWKNGPDFGLHYGLIAQEVERAIYDARGFEDKNVITSKDEKSDLYGIKYTELISPMIKAIQELHCELTQVKKELSDLKEKELFK